ncbi:hypothetical protein K2D_05400 [Planctomycetes bacterium K2D]|uniref:Uncharacterized protein n=1 Tax=Botrimarina mediterranea TaxID=2528022 RepID=A0A518K3Q3_9BACT|nr:hypothetical protein Spa11_05850 [Botrimarina mediterranea]QDV76956.1 hypothetical protein K2D_05400 [Planctomycetes bacterium K2D]
MSASTLGFAIREPLVHPCNLFRWRGMKVRFSLVLLIASVFWAITPFDRVWANRPLWEQLFACMLAGIGLVLCYEYECGEAATFHSNRIALKFKNSLNRGPLRYLWGRSEWVWSEVDYVSIDDGEASLRPPRIRLQFREGSALEIGLLCAADANNVRRWLSEAEVAIELRTPGSPEHSGLGSRLTRFWRDALASHSLKYGLSAWLL